MTIEAEFGVAMKRDRAVIVVAIVILIALAWAYTAHVGLRAPPVSHAMATPSVMPWTAADFGYMLVMWAVMMVAMMLPSATPMIFLYARVREKRRGADRPYAPTAAFVGGYLLTWTGFSLLATMANWELHTGGVLSSMMGRVAPATGGALLIVAGLFQWTPLKHACLKHCRSPIGFFVQNWRDGLVGATMMGLHHGAYCLGCCWLLMVLLFALGVMNLPWVAVLTTVVLAEKVLPRGEVLSRVLGALLVLWGVWLVVISWGLTV